MSIKPITLAALALSSIPANAGDGKPNVIYILADDLGYGDVSSYNPNGKFHTPAIDSLASEGVSFMNAHTTSGVSTPSRYSILTGRYNWRTKMQTGVLWSYDLPLINKERETVATLMSDNGYITGIIGKWHLGLGWVKDENGEIDHNADLTESPSDNGFDYSYVMPASLDIPPYIYFENKKPTANVTRVTEGNPAPGFWRKGYIADDFDIQDALYHFTDKATDFIQENADEPFFLYFPLTAPHAPILPDEKFAGKTISTYGDFVLMVDEVVRRIVAAVEKAGITENTMIVFTADNGFAPAGNLEEQISKGHNPVGELRGHKADIYEGGHRVPYIVKAPSLTKKIDVKIDAPISQVGLFATMAHLVGAPINEGEAVDSESHLQAIKKGKQPKQLADKPIVVHSHDGHFAIIVNNWKLCLTPGSGGWSYPRVGKEKPGSPDVQLFNLDDNISENSDFNLCNEEPELVNELRNQLYEIVEAAPNDVKVVVNKMKK